MNPVQSSASSAKSVEEPSENHPEIDYQDSSTLDCLWHKPLEIRKMPRRNEALGSWVLNPAVGCSYGCKVCYAIPAPSGRQSELLAQRGILDPLDGWGTYAFPRRWDEQVFLCSLSRAEMEAYDRELAGQDNQAILVSSTTDPYQPFAHADLKQFAELNQLAANHLRAALTSIRDLSEFKVRILTRSPLVTRDFDLFQSFGDRLVLTVSLPTLNEQILKVYEPGAPSANERLETLYLAREMVLHLDVMLTPGYPECDEADLRATLKAVRHLQLNNLFYEPLRLSPKSPAISEVQQAAQGEGLLLNRGFYRDLSRWQPHAFTALSRMEQVAADLGLSDQLHLLPPPSLSSRAALKQVKDPEAKLDWLNQCWQRQAAWPDQQNPS
ncbi:MAG: hypothetical protein ACPGFB_11055 [Verrucomicrobiales bacterium]